MHKDSKPCIKKKYSKSYDFSDEDKWSKLTYIFQEIDIFPENVIIGNFPEKILKILHS